MSWAERAGQVGNRQRKKTGALLGIAEQMHSFVVDAANAGAKAGGLVPHANQIKIGLVHALRSIGMPASRPVTDLRRGAFHERCTSGRSTEFTYAWRHSLARPPCPCPAACPTPPAHECDRLAAHALAGLAGARERRA